MMRRTTRTINPILSGSADAILTADLHLTEHTPISRTDDYLAAQERKLAFLQQLSDKNNKCPILIAGDALHNWRNSPWFIYWLYTHLPEKIIAIPGNHELPMHSFVSYHKSTLHLLENILKKDELLKFTVLKNEATCAANFAVYGAPFGKDLDPKNLPWGKRRRGDARTVLLLHDFIWRSAHKPSWATEAYTPEEILGKFGAYVDLIVTGDNHESFIAEKNGTILVNPGSMLRSNADQWDFRPRCFLYYAKPNKVVPVEYPIEEEVHNREHLDRKKEHDDRTEAYIARMNTSWKGGLSFRDNLQLFFSANNTAKKVRELLWQHLERERI